jgi:hypothetical protein
MEGKMLRELWPFWFLVIYLIFLPAGERKLISSPGPGLVNSEQPKKEKDKFAHIAIDVCKSSNEWLQGWFGEPEIEV